MVVEEKGMMVVVMSLGDVAGSEEKMVKISRW